MDTPAYTHRCPWWTGHLLTPDSLRVCEQRRRLLASVKELEDLTPKALHALMECIGCPGPVALPVPLPVEMRPLEPGQVVALEERGRGA